MNPVLALAFEFPPRLWLLVGVVALAAVYVFTSFRRKTYAVRFTNLALLDSVAPKRPGWRRHVPAVFLLLALAVLVGAFAKPTADKRVPRERATIMVAIDTSLSMEATDVKPNRIEAAKAAAKRFLDVLPERINVGLVTFDATAQVRVTPTRNREEVKAAIDGMRLSERTAIGEAIFASLDAIKSSANIKGQGKVPARIILMSDGETTTGRPDSQAIAAAKKAKVPVSTIAIGTPEGTIDLPGQAQPVSVAVNKHALAKIANDTDGTAFTADTAKRLQKVYEDIGSSVGYITVQGDVSGAFTGIALILLFAAAALSQVWFSRLP